MLVRIDLKIKISSQTQYFDVSNTCLSLKVVYFMYYHNWMEVTSPILHVKNGSLMSIILQLINRGAKTEL